MGIREIWESDWLAKAIFIAPLAVVAVMLIKYAYFTPGPTLEEQRLKVLGEIAAAEISLDSLHIERMRTVVIHKFDLKLLALRKSDSTRDLYNSLKEVMDLDFDFKSDMLIEDRKYYDSLLDSLRRCLARIDSQISVKNEGGP